MKIRAAAAVIAVLAGGVLVAPARAADPTCVETWHEIGAESFPLPGGLLRSQGVSTDGTGWVFSWQGGLERTDDAYRTEAVATWPPSNFTEPSINLDGTNHVANTHIGDVDVFDGKVYAPIEDGSEGPFNDPEYQHPYIALYDAKSLLPTGERYPLPLDLHAAGVPWVAVNGAAGEVYTAEWDMPHDRINVFDLQMRFLRFIPLQTATGERLSRIQGAKLFDGQLYATRDDATKSVWKIDLSTGQASRLFSLGWAGEMEGLAFRPTPDGAQMHVIFIHDNTDYTKIRSSLHHFALTPCS
ncbi:MAG: hypothetical protein QOE35_2026 [Actinomycetota bacterium]